MADLPEALEYAPADEPTSTRAQRVAWMLYDWANSGYGLIWGVIFPEVFVKIMLPEQPTWPRREMKGEMEIVTGLNVFGGQMPGSSVFALIVSAVAFCTVLCAPVLGAVADGRGWQKRMFVGFATVGSLIAMAAVFLPVGQGVAWPIAMVLHFASFLCFGLSITFYNAYLPLLAPESRQGRLGGWGFAIGYVGGAVALIIGGLVFPKLLTSLDSARVLNFALALGGLWWIVFSLPAFFLLPSVPPSHSTDQAALHNQGLLGPFKKVLSTLKHLRQYRMLFLFLLAFLIYINGVESVINLSSVFGVDVLGMNTTELTTMFLIVQFVAFAGAAICGYIADKVGNKPVIMVTLAVWCVGVGLTWWVKTPGQFTMLGILIGLVLGGVQSSSRTLMSVLSPKEIRNEAFGFYAIGSKAVSIFGPLLFAGVGMVAGPRASVLAVLPFLSIGLLLLIPVKEREALRAGFEVG